MKKFVLGLLIGIMLTLGVTTYAVPEIKEAVFSDITLTVNGVTLDTDVVSVTTTDNPNYMTNYVSARDLAESLGATVTWDGKERAINITSEDTTVDTPTVQTAPASEIMNDTDLPSIVEIDGFKGVGTAGVYKALKAKGYDLVNAANREYMQIIYDNKIVVRDIPSKICTGNKIIIPYDFYETNILPLLQ